MEARPIRTADYSKLLLNGLDGLLHVGFLHHLEQVFRRDCHHLHIGRVQFLLHNLLQCVQCQVDCLVQRHHIGEVTLNRYMENVLEIIQIYTCLMWYYVEQPIIGFQLQKATYGIPTNTELTEQASLKTQTEDRWKASSNWKLQREIIT